MERGTLGFASYTQWRFKFKCCFYEAAALSSTCCVHGRCWEVGVWFVPCALVSVPSTPVGDFGEGLLRSKQLCLSLCVGQVCARPCIYRWSAGEAAAC